MDRPVDLAAGLIDLVETGQGYRANAAVFETGADLWDVLATVKRD
jgi:flagellar basal-body rod protein FlgC